jgi:solute carrier family 35, member E1
MPHSTLNSSSIGGLALNRPSNLKSFGDAKGEPMEKFPEYPGSQFGSGARESSPRKSNGHANGGATSSDRWLPRRESSQSRGTRWGQPEYGHGHERQKSLGDAIRTIRTRHGSVSQNAHEIADALRAPVSPKLIVRTPVPVLRLLSQCTDASCGRFSA